VSSECADSNSSFPLASIHTGRPRKYIDSQEFPSWRQQTSRSSLGDLHGESLRFVLEACVSLTWDQVLVTHSCICDVCHSVRIRNVFVIKRATEDSVLHVSHLLLHYLLAVLCHGDRVRLVCYRSGVRQRLPVTDSAHQADTLDSISVLVSTQIALGSRPQTGANNIAG
jgi:hypothetical protein